MTTDALLAVLCDKIDADLEKLETDIEIFRDEFIKDSANYKDLENKFENIMQTHQETQHIRFFLLNQQNKFDNKLKIIKEFHKSLELLRYEAKE